MAVMSPADPATLDSHAMRRFGVPFAQLTDPNYIEWTLAQAGGSAPPAAAPTMSSGPGAIMSPAAMAALRNEILASIRPAMGGTVDPTTIEALNAMRPSMTGTSATAQSLMPFIQGQPGSSPMTDAAIEAFKVKTLPIIQQQMLLKGLGHSPAVSQVTGETLAMALPEFINNDMTNRLRAAEIMNAERNTAGGLFASTGGRVADTRRDAITSAGNVLSGEANFGLKGTELAANIANAESMRDLEAFRSAGQLQLGLADSQARAAQIQQEQQKLALRAGQGAGGLQRDITQGVSDAYQAERLRLQGLSEGASFGVFGGQTLTPLQQKTTGSQSSSK